MPVSERGEQRFWVCPECAHGAFQPFDCGGPHRNIKANGKPGKRLVYRFVRAVQVAPITDYGAHLRHVTEDADRAS